MYAVAMDGVSESVDSLDTANSAITRIKDCRSETEVAAILRPLIQFFGLESYVFVSLNRDDEGRESHRFLIGCRPEWCQMYNARKWFAIDPFIAHALRSSEPIVGSKIKAESAGQIELLATAREHGFHSGMVVPAHSGVKSRIGVLYLGSPRTPDEVEPRLLQSRSFLRAIALELFEWHQAKLQADMLGNVAFDDADIELLREVHDGYHSKDLGRAKNLSVSQVNNRFRRINAAFKVRSRKAAAAKAVDLGVLRMG